MMIDAYEIYGHDPTDKLDHLAHYQIEMMKIKRAPDQGLYWYPQWMGAPPHHPYPRSGDSPVDLNAEVPGVFYPHNSPGEMPPEIPAFRIGTN
ncbi:jg11079 [Pararge aegeria aegeria]|uniref:Jg11079 protein n=1 Tax=Pararge aegeria aegeria TaxID=348720 RepID=A0A8S4R755_9NEOP|nr:jg11079 [Pararge aegeria aegeria]